MQSLTLDELCLVSGGGSIKTIAIYGAIGGGIMGAGIALIPASAGIFVVVTTSSVLEGSIMACVPMVLGSLAGASGGLVVGGAVGFA